MSKSLKMLSLFSGIGGIDLAAQWAGVETVAFCEIDLFCQKVLNKHWPTVPIFDNIFELNKEKLDERNIAAIDIVAGGFPCQPFSVAGKQRGKEDDRYLWPEMFRIISEIRPHWVVGENVSGFVNMALDETVSQLESIGYSVQAFLIPACAVGALHQRERCFIVANANINNAYTSEIVSKKCLEQNKEIPSDWETFQFINRGNYSFSFRKEDESRICRDGDGIPKDMDRLKSLGNAVVPQHIYPIFHAIATIESMTSEGE